MISGDPPGRALQRYGRVARWPTSTWVGAGHGSLLDKPELCLLMIKDRLDGGTDGVPR
jgi:hypothetical protein